MNGILTLWSRIEEAFWNVCGFGEDVIKVTEEVRKNIKGKLEKCKKLFFQAVGLEIGLLILLAIASGVHNRSMVFFSTVGAVVLIIVVYLLSAAVKDVLVFATKMIPESKDKKIAEERKKGLEKLELNLIKFVNTLNYGGMAIATISLWMLVFGFSTITWSSIQIMILLVLIFSMIGFFAKSEVVWPRKIVLALAVISGVFWFSDLDTTPSRVLASWLNVVQVNTEENVDKWNGAIAKTNAVLYSTNSIGEMQENGKEKILTTSTQESGKDTILAASQFVRFTSAKGETRRINGELFTKVIIPNETGSYGRGNRYWIQSSFLERGLKFYPNANTPEYAMSKNKCKENGKEVWEIYFLTDEPIHIPAKMGWWYTFSASAAVAGEITDTNNPRNGEWINYTMNRVSQNTHENVFPLQSRKGNVLTITWSRG